jgi:hypothetical protein
MQIKAEKFPYQPLTTSGFSIRVLNLHPGQASEPISCTLGQYDMSLNEGWTCLSYTWGTEPPTREVFIDGHSFLVRSNVHEFLCQARQKGINNLWIDSICINQSDDEERTAQVQLMGTIFSDAKLVVIWLGQSSPDLEEAVQLLHTFITPSRKRISVAEGIKVFPRLTHAQCSSLFEACGAAIWTRRWVKQEILLPCNAELWCGRACVNVHVFFAAIDVLVDYTTMHGHRVPGGASSGSQGEATTCPDDTLTLDQRAALCFDVLSLRGIPPIIQTRLDLPWLLEAFKTSACTDFHDAIYAFRGLLYQGSLLRVDYRLSKGELLMDTLDFIARTSHRRLPGSSLNERNLLANIYRGLHMNKRDLESVLGSYPRAYIVQVGYSWEMLRKGVTVYRFADSLADLGLREGNRSELKGECRSPILDGGVLHGGQVALHELQGHDFKTRSLWLYGLQDDCATDLNCLRALHAPKHFYGCGEGRAAQLKRLMSEGQGVQALVFDPGERERELRDWLKEVRNRYVVTVTDADDAGLQLQVSVLPGCKDESCLLNIGAGGEVPTELVVEENMSLMVSSSIKRG